ncbi:MATE family efflux transporter [Sphingomonas sp.]|uniref:MATE family efflux transporter n=1 Tax=Sphingomonas sp. TaxID=28214 RepID=UPI00286E0E83|nr:MATE family efflux transporter [Sphingomonas sp.]
MDAPAQLQTDRPWRGELGATLALAWPLILSNLTMALIQATDVVLMGWLGPLPLAASALGLNLTFVFLLLGIGVVTASSPMIATALGRRSSAVRDVRRSFRQACWVAVVISFATWAVLWNAEPIIRALGQEPALARGAATFLRGYMWSILPFLLFQAMRNFLSALERPAWIFIVSAAGIVLNAVVCWALIFGKFGLPALGLFGGGLGSSIVWACLALTLAIVIATGRKTRRFHLFGRWWRADWPRFRHIWRLGLPIGLTMAFEGAVFGAAAYLMGLIDAESIAAHAIALQIAALSFMVPLGLGQAATVRVGRAFGRGDHGGIARAGWTAWLLGVGFMAAMALAMWIFPRELVGLFLSDSAANARVIGLAVSFLAIAALFQIVDGAQVVGAGMLRGLHDTRVPMLFALVGYWVIGLGVGVWLAFYRGWQGVGIWTGLAAGLAFVAVLMIARWAMRERLALVP